MNKPPNPSKRADLTPLAMNELSWRPDDFAGSIEQLANGVRGKAAEAIEWYVKAKRPKRVGATLVRTLTIASTTAAGILTVLAQYFDGVPDGELNVHPIWISVALAISVALLGLDRFFGFSRAWIRYVGAELKIRTALNDFNMSWPLRMIDWDDGVPDATQAREAISACTSFRSEIDAMVRQETDQWIADFQASMKDLEEATKAAQAAAEAEEQRRKDRESARKAEQEADKPGGVNVTVSNGDQCENGWKLVVGDGTPQPCHGKSGAVEGVPPGLAKIVVEGRIGGKPKRAEKVVTISAATVDECQLTLE